MLLSEDIKHLGRVVLIHLATKGADEDFFWLCVGVRHRSCVEFLHEGAGAGVDPVG
jgi:hypothetical protein